MSQIHVTTTVNGDATEFLCEADETLLDVLRDHLDLTGRHVRVGLARRSGAHQTIDGQHPLLADAAGQLGRFGRNRRIDHDLGDAIAVAQVEEAQAAVIAATVQPAGQGHFGADLLGAQLATGMGSVHRIGLPFGMRQGQDPFTDQHRKRQGPRGAPVLGKAPPLGPRRRSGRWCPPYGHCSYSTTSFPKMIADESG